MKDKIQYYSLDKILQKKAQYNLIIGERSNGKTYAVLKHALQDFIKNGNQLAIVRRYDEDIKGRRGDSFYEALVSNDEISKMTDGKYTFIKHVNRKFYLAYHDDNLDKDITDEKPCAYSFSITGMEHDKSTSYPRITNIMFDEFITRQMYLPNEFVSFMNVISTIIRHRNDVTIFMLGNTVNQYCIYFKEMGLVNVLKMKQGKIDVYSYGNSELKVAIEYCGTGTSTKPSDAYFAFNNPKLEMITGGVWEMAIYPHCPVKYKPKDVVFNYFIDFNGDLLQCEVVNTGDSSFTFIHRKTTPIQNPETDIIYTLEYSEKPNYHRRLMKPVTKWQKMIATYFLSEKVFYQDNEVGEIVRNYLITSTGDKFT